jgi:hypothetical protein
LLATCVDGTVSSGQLPQMDTTVDNVHTMDELRYLIHNAFAKENLLAASCYADSIRSLGRPREKGVAPDKHLPSCQSGSLGRPSHHVGEGLANRTRRVRHARI